jgi:hypothetical protein
MMIGPNQALMRLMHLTDTILTIGIHAHAASRSLRLHAVCVELVVLFARHSCVIKSKHFEVDRFDFIFADGKERQFDNGIEFAMDTKLISISQAPHVPYNDLPFDVVRCGHFTFEMREFVDSRKEKLGRLLRPIEAEVIRHI